LFVNTEIGGQSNAAQVIEELIEMAKEMNAAKGRGEELGLNSDELAFYDALGNNISAKEVMGDEQLVVIAHELLESVKRSVSVDWSRRENARAQIRLTVKRILKKYGYPPDLQESATALVLEQAEALCEAWS
jgi:type I restriction enzyme R subunit